MLWTNQKCRFDCWVRNLYWTDRWAYRLDPSGQPLLWWNAIFYENVPLKIFHCYHAAEHCWDFFQQSVWRVQASGYPCKWSVMILCVPVFSLMKSCCLQVCGGGPSLSLWHLRSLSLTTVFETPNAAVNFAMFHDDAVSWQHTFLSSFFPYYQR